MIDKTLMTELNGRKEFQGWKRRRIRNITVTTLMSLVFIVSSIWKIQIIGTSLVIFASVLLLALCIGIILASHITFCQSGTVQAIATVDEVIEPKTVFHFKRKKECNTPQTRKVTLYQVEFTSGKFRDAKNLCDVFDTTERRQIQKGDQVILFSQGRKQSFITHLSGGNCE